MNEISLLVGSYVLMEFTDYQSDPIFKYKIGWFLTSIMALNLIANISAMFYKIGSVIFQNIKNLMNKRKNAKKY
jgi:hypothetical protein